MEETKHLESPGLNLSESKDKAVQYILSKHKKALENIFTEASNNLRKSPWRLNDELLIHVER
jgi:hypothetical protein